MNDQIIALIKKYEWQAREYEIKAGETAYGDQCQNAYERKYYRSCKEHCDDIVSDLKGLLSAPNTDI